MQFCNFIFRIKSSFIRFQSWQKKARSKIDLAISEEIVRVFTWATHLRNFFAKLLYKTSLQNFFPKLLSENSFRNFFAKLLCKTSLRNFFAKLLCETFLRNFFAKLLCETYLQNLFAKFLCKTSLYYRIPLPKGINSTLYLSKCIKQMSRQHFNTIFIIPYSDIFCTDIKNNICVNKLLGIPLKIALKIRLHYWPYSKTLLLVFIDSIIIR